MNNSMNENKKEFVFARAAVVVLTVVLIKRKKKNKEKIIVYIPPVDNSNDQTVGQQRKQSKIKFVYCQRDFSS